MTKLNDGIPEHLNRNERYKFRHPERIKESSKKYAESHKEQIKEYNKSWREKNKDTIKEKMKKYYDEHIQEKKEYGRKYNQENKEIIRQKTRRRLIPKKYGISREEYNNILLNQNNKCAICGRSDNLGKEFCVDHDHTSNKVRGLLCGRCNQGLGLFQDDLNILKIALSYLEKNK